MLRGLVVILACQLVGEFLVRAVGAPIPGAVVGMALFFLLLLWRRPEPSDPLVRAGDGLLRYLPLLFVPAGAGVVAYGAQLGSQWPAVAAGLIVSWLATVVVVGWVAQLTAPRRDGRGER